MDPLQCVYWRSGSVTTDGANTKDSLVDYISRVLRAMFEPNNGTEMSPGSIDSDRRRWTQGETLRDSPRTEVISHVTVCTHSSRRGEVSGQT
jgi:hypothetical protein